MARSATTPHRTRSALPRAPRAALLIAGAACAPVLAAQAAAADSAPATQTHEVRRGDTLWDLARAYLSDPYQWPAIYRINGDVVRDPHWIYPGESIRIPVAGPGIAPSAPEATVPEATVFDSRAATPLAVSVARAPVVPPRAVRPREVYAAPWVGVKGGPSAHGELVALVAPAGIAQADDSRQRVQLRDRVYAMLPPGSSAREGELFMVVTRGREVGDAGELVIPSAVVRVREVGKGRAATVEVMEMYDDTRLGQWLIPVEGVSIPTTATPAPVELGVERHVVMVPRDPVIPSLLHYIVLDATWTDGVAIGDQFTLYRDPPKELENAADFPREAIALAQVVRVTDRGTTAIIVDQRHPGIRPGLKARLTAKMP
jgi:hypothetical protein